MKQGESSVRFTQGVYIECYASVVGSKEGEGPLAEYFDEAYRDDTFGQRSWEEAESRLQNRVIHRVLEKSGRKPEQIRYLLSGDLLGQLIATSFGVKEFGIPTFGVYGACSTMGEAMSLGSVLVDSGNADRVLALASSHYASAQKQFRYPIDYGNQRPLSSTWTVTGAGCVLLGREKSAVRVAGITTGKIMDYGVKDSMNMGAVMAPAAAQTIAAHLKDFRRAPEEYDAIITGDLGLVGQKVLLELLDEKGFRIGNQHLDCGIMIYDNDKQDTHSGGSGCGCSASVLCGMIMRKLEQRIWNRVLFVPTGALLSPTSFNEGLTIPSIAHGVLLERED